MCFVTSRCNDDFPTLLLLGLLHESDQFVLLYVNSWRVNLVQITSVEKKMIFNRREVQKMHEIKIFRGKYIFAKCNILVFFHFFYVLQPFLYFHEWFPVQEKCKKKYVHLARLKLKFHSQQRLLKTEQWKKREIALQKIYISNYFFSFTKQWHPLARNVSVGEGE